jgi:hypothetical protein
LQRLCYSYCAFLVCRLLWLWSHQLLKCSNLPIVVNKSHLVYPNTVRKLYHILDSVIQSDLDKNPIGRQGGVGHIIQIDESVLIRRKVRNKCAGKNQCNSSTYYTCTCVWLFFVLSILCFNTTCDVVWF